MRSAGTEGAADETGADAVFGEKVAWEAVTE